MMTIEVSKHLPNLDFDVYVLIDPRDKRVKYVGQSWDAVQRLRAHLHRGKQTLTKPIGLWLAELRREGLLPMMEVIAGARDACEAGFVERHWIRYFRKRGESLFNVRCGKS